MTGFHRDDIDDGEIVVTLMHCPHTRRKPGIALVPYVVSTQEGTGYEGPFRRLVLVYKCVACGHSVKREV